MRIFTIIVALLLLITALINLHVGIAYYQVLRWVTTICAAIWAYKLYNQNQILFIIFCAIAILFNPIAPIYLEKFLWRIVDFISSIFFILQIIKIKDK